MRISIVCIPLVSTFNSGPPRQRSRDRRGGPDQRQGEGVCEVSDSGAGDPGGPQSAGESGPGAAGGQQGETGQTGRSSLLPVVGVSREAKTSVPKRQRPWLRPLIIVLVVLALLVTVPWGIGYWRWSQTHVSTDDAY